MLSVFVRGQRKILICEILAKRYEITVFAYVIAHNSKTNDFRKIFFCAISTKGLLNLIYSDKLCKWVGSTIKKLYLYLLAYLAVPFKNLFWFFQLFPRVCHF